MRGKFITIEGNDGSGKTTVVSAIKDRLSELNIPCIFTREPGGSTIAEKIRQIILDPENSEMDSRTEALLYAASRREHLVHTIIPALEAGKIVICDRYIDSSLAYQGYARGIGSDCVYDMNLFATESLLPDLTIFLLVEPDLGIKRKKNQKTLDRMEKEALAFHQSVYNGYLELAQNDPQRIKIVNGNVTIADEITSVIKVIDDFLGVE